MFSNEFRVRVRRITSPTPSSIRFSNARMESMLISGPVLDVKPVSDMAELECALTHTEDIDCSQLGESGDSSP